MNRVQLPVDSEVLQHLAVGRVMAERINAVVARPTSKRHSEYLELLNRQIRGYGDVDPDDVYRDRELVPVALAAYEARNGVQLGRGWFYQHPDYDMTGCRPDGVEGHLIGLTAHIRQTEETYEKAVEDSMNAQYMRAAQASMAVTGLPYWIHLDYWEDRNTRKRRLYETLFERNPLADELLLKLAYFYCRAAQAHLEAA